MRRPGIPIYLRPPDERDEEEDERLDEPMLPDDERLEEGTE